jgi:hypothetical protein
VLTAYGVFFAYGWLLFGSRDLLASFGRRWAAWFSAGTIVAAAYLACVVARPIAGPSTRMLEDSLRAGPTSWHIASVGLAALSTWLLIFGIVGFFVRHLVSQKPVVRYFSDASYWIYLTHLAPILWGVALLARADAPALVKFVLVLAFSTLVTTITYHYFVRSTAIGALLNGRRYPRSLVKGSSVPEEAALSN